MQKKSEGKNAFEVVLDGSHNGAVKGAPEGTPEGASKFSLSNFQKDVQEGAFEVAPKILI